MTKKLYRSRSDKKLCGVCGGLADYFDLDVNIIRVAAIVSCFFGGIDASLSEDESRLLRAWNRLSPDSRQALLNFLATLG